MQILRRAVVPLFLIMMVCAVSVYFYVSDNGAVMVSAGFKERITVIIDPGHPSLRNTKNTMDFQKIIKYRPRKFTSEL